MSDKGVSLAPAAEAGIGRRFFLFYFFVILVGSSRFLFQADVFEGPHRTQEDTALLPSLKTKRALEKTTIAFAVTITKFRSGKSLPATTLYDRAAVLHQSLKAAMQQSDRYDYHLYAFVHPDAIEVKPRMEQLGFRVQIRETPFNVTDIQNKELVKAQNRGCCGEKEYLKLYSYLMFDYPVVVHIDMDYLILKPMEDIFDLMTDPSYNRTKFQRLAMWTDMTNYNGSIDFVHTRDYNMIEPPKRQPHQVGIQGGFLVVRPSQDDFDKLVSVILSGGGFVRGKGWGGLNYGGYYGSGTIQGLASYYYGHLEPNREIELNRCYHNTMADDPMGMHKQIKAPMCRTLQETCQDCRETPLEEIYSVHFTICGKPEWCPFQHEVSLCQKLHVEWHKVRTSLEQEWMEKFPDYDPGLAVIGNRKSERKQAMRLYGGHCGPNYSPLVFPVPENETVALI